MPPQPFGAVPQFCPAAHACWAPSGVHPHMFATLGVPPPQVSGGEQDPQAKLLPQPSDTGPQFLPMQATILDTGVQPHTFAALGVPPPHVCGGVQDPQLNMPPQPSATAPQFLPAHAAAVVFGVQPHTLGDPGFPPPQV